MGLNCILKCFWVIVKTIWACFKTLSSIPCAIYRNWCPQQLLYRVLFFPLDGWQIYEHQYLCDISNILSFICLKLLCSASVISTEAPRAKNIPVSVTKTLRIKAAGDRTTCLQCTDCNSLFKFQTVATWYVTAHTAPDHSPAGSRVITHSWVESAWTLLRHNTAGVGGGAFRQSNTAAKCSQQSCCWIRSLGQIKEWDERGQHHWNKDTHTHAQIHMDMSNKDLSYTRTPTGWNSLQCTQGGSDWNHTHARAHAHQVYHFH